MILTGCVSQADPKLVADLEKTNVSIVGLSYTDRIVEAVEDVLQNRQVYMMDFLKNPLKDAPKLPALMLPKVRKNKYVEIICINTGCLGDCNYCKTKQARGTLRSYPIEQIVARVEMAFKEGVQQIWMTSEDTGAYGLDMGTNIVELMRAVLEVVPEHGMLRLGMTNPPYMARHAAAIAELLLHPRCFEFLHVPVGCFGGSCSNSKQIDINVDLMSFPQFRQILVILVGWEVRRAVAAHARRHDHRRK